MRAAAVWFCALIIAAEAAPACFAQGNPEWLFIQNVESGTLTASSEPDQAGVYILKLKGVPPETAAMTDSPTRGFVTVPTKDFAAGWTKAQGGFLNSLPKAVLEILDDETRDIVALELKEPSYDPTTRELVYRARILNETEARPKGFENRSHRENPPPSFGPALLFISDYGYNWD